MRLYTETITIPTADYSGVSSLPPLTKEQTVYQVDRKNFALGEEDGLFVNYEEVNGIFPYKYQDQYGRELKPVGHKAAILENDCIKATFLLDLGGRLWSLFDKKTGKELLFRNSVIRPGNLALRNAWVSGGIEWNFGYRGHHPYTSDDIFAAEARLGDGTPVLRIYEFERVRRLAYQVDFFLKENSPLLFVRTRLKNESFDVIPVYWWSNVAVPEGEKDRVIVGADEAYIAPKKMLRRIGRGYFGNIDVSYPRQTRFALDYFWRTPDERRKYVLQVDENGYGLCEFSTPLLKGRKLFVWGDSDGGRRWQNFLSGDRDTGSYDEIQCGLAFTQYENLPLPPQTAWEWMECYGPVQLSAAEAHGDITEAQRAAERAVNDMMTEEEMQQLLHETHGAAVTPAVKQLNFGSGWGRLEQLRREHCGERPHCPHLNFGGTGKEQADWLNLLKSGTMGQHDASEIPVSYMYQPEWTQLLLCAAENKDRNNWYTNYQLALVYLREGDLLRAGIYAARSRRLSVNAWTEYLFSAIAGVKGDRSGEVRALRRAYRLRSEDYSIAKEYFRVLDAAGRAAEIVRVYGDMCAALRERPRIRFYYIRALLRVGKAERAMQLLTEGGGLEIPDIREGEVSVTELWLDISEVLAAKKGEKFDRGCAEVPKNLDFRMFAALEDCIR